MLRSTRTPYPASNSALAVVGVTVYNSSAKNFLVVSPNSRKEERDAYGQSGARVAWLYANIRELRALTHKRRHQQTPGMRRNKGGNLTLGPKVKNGFSSHCCVFFFLRRYLTGTQCVKDENVWEFWRGSTDEGQKVAT